VGATQAEADACALRSSPRASSAASSLCRLPCRNPEATAQEQLQPNSCIRHFAKETVSFDLLIFGRRPKISRSKETVSFAKCRITKDLELMLLSSVALPV